MVYKADILMATVSKPQTIADLARVLGIPLEDALVPCNFCKKFLTYLEAVEFDVKQLCLIWKEDLVFGCCRCCCVASATFEFDNYLNDSVVGWAIEDKEKKPLSEIIVRCRHCMKKLDQIEKLDICGRSLLFYKVRRGWKGLCRQCKQI